MGKRHRVGVGLFIALCGIATAVGSELVWVKAGHGRSATGINHTSLAGLLHWSDQHTNSFAKSFAIVIVIAGVLVVVGGLFGWVVPAALFAAIAFVAGGLWLGLYASSHSTSSIQFSNLGLGALVTIGGSLLALIFTSALRRRA
ncbi:MAG TPA: hypothetical protein VMA95_01990 [Streptosporangiaceae bacterium]|nr:hypothetical protein [Streptosporangiaceae bacterium]